MNPRSSIRNNAGEQTFDPDEMMARVERLKSEGRLPTSERFLKALKEAIVEEKQERKTHKRKLQ